MSNAKERGTPVSELMGYDVVLTTYPVAEIEWRDAARSRVRDKARRRRAPTGRFSRRRRARGPAGPAPLRRLVVFRVAIPRGASADRHAGPSANCRWW